MATENKSGGAWAAITSVAHKAAEAVKTAGAAVGKTVVHGVSGIKDFIAGRIEWVKDKWNGTNPNPYYDRTMPAGAEYGD